MTDEPASPTAAVRDRLTAARLSDERIEEHSSPDPDMPAPAGTRAVIDQTAPD